MKGILAAGLVLTLIIVPVEAQAQGPGDEGAIVALEHRLAAAWVERDLPFIERLLSSDWSVIDQSGRLRTKQQVFDETFSSTDRRIDAMAIDDLNVRLFGTTAVVTGRTRATGSYRGQSATVVLRFTDVFHFRQDRWQIVASQGTTVAQ